MVNQALKLARVYHNLKQKELAEALDLSPSYLNEIESGKKQVTMEILDKYSKFFRLPTSSLLYFAEQQSRGGARPDGNPISAKAIKMLDWLDTITREDDEQISA